MQPPMDRNRKLNPMATVFDKPQADAEDQGVAQQLSQMQAEIDDLKQRVAALEGDEQGEGQEPEAAGMMGS